MKVGRTSGTTGSSGPSGPRAPAGGSSFNLPATGAAGSATPAARAGGVTGVASLDALLALQQADGPLERRRKAVGRAGKILDVLDDLRLAVIDGEVSGAHLEHLVRAVRDQREGTDDPGLEGVLDEIEMRAAVELAKLQRAKIAA
jgi:hypothetical protein